MSLWQRLEAFARGSLWVSFYSFGGWAIGQYVGVIAVIGFVLLVSCYWSWKLQQMMGSDDDEND